MWDTLKAYLRGEIISCTKELKKIYKAETEELERKILRLEKEFQQRRDKNIYNMLVNKKLIYKHCMYRAEKTSLRMKQRYYELRKKAHKVLSWQLKKEESSRTINLKKKVVALHKIQ